jgi:hypothetical protein
MCLPSKFQLQGFRSGANGCIPMRGFFHKAVLFRRKAAALLLVLGSVALLALLVVALLTLSRTDQKSSRAFEESISVRSLAEVPVNVVIGQIRSATTDLGNEKTWASQPGMIRVFGNEQRASDFRSATDRVYRLYSHNTLVSMGTDFDPDLEVPPGDWATQTGLFTDLNEPVVQVAPGTGEPRPVYPILDAGELYEVEGFELSAVPGGPPRYNLLRCRFVGFMYWRMVGWWHQLNKMVTRSVLAGMDRLRKIRLPVGLPFGRMMKVPN